MSQWAPGGVLVMAMFCDVPWVMVPHPDRQTAANETAAAVPNEIFMMRGSPAYKMRPFRILVRSRNFAYAVPSDDNMSNTLAGIGLRRALNLAAFLAARQGDGDDGAGLFAAFHHQLAVMLADQ